MKLDRENSAGNLIRGCANGQVLVGSQAFEFPVIITIDRIVQDWTPAQCTVLTLDDLQPVLDLEPEVILLGTGSRQRFPPAMVTAAVLGRGIGIEVMDTAAACRTYNVLASEFRRVALALLIA